MSERITSFSIAPGTNITLPLVAFTGFQGELRSPLPTPDFQLIPADGSVFTVAVANGTDIVITGVAEGVGEIILKTPTRSSKYKVKVEYLASSERWEFAYSGITVGGTPVAPPMILTVDKSADPTITVSWSGVGADREQAVDWRDGTSETVPAGQTSATHTYTANGTYEIGVTPKPEPDDPGTLPTATAEFTVAQVPPPPEEIVFNVDLAADPLAAIVMSVGVNPIKVDWGDGHVDTDIAPDQASHMYAQNGQYTITVSTSVPGYAPGTSEISINNADLSGASAPPPDTICYGPFDIPGLQQFWVCTAPSVPDWFSVAIDIYGEPGPDLQVFGAQLASALDDFPQEQVAVAIAKVREVWGR